MLKMLSELLAHWLKRRPAMRQEIVIRVIADAIILNVALVIGLVTRLLALLSTNEQIIRRDGTASFIVPHLYIAVPLLTAIGVLSHFSYGLYTRARFYQTGYKALLILQSNTISFVAFGFLTFFVRGLTPHPRSSLLVAWASACLLSAAARFWSQLWRGQLQSEMALASTPASAGIRNVVVIGGAGYIGSLLVRRLLDDGFRVTVLDALFYGGDSLNDVSNHPGFTLRRGDSRDIGAIVSVVRDADAVVHLGEIVGDPASALDERLTGEINVAATTMIGEVARAYRVQRFVYASSCSVYGFGHGDMFLDEQSALQPVSTYARAKIAAEKALLSLTTNEFRPTILRLATVYGLSPRPRFDLVVNLLAARATVESEIVIFGGDQWRPFVHVKDVVEAITKVLLAKNEVVGGEVFNVGSNEQNVRIADIGRLVEGLIPGTRTKLLSDNSDPRNYRVDFAKIHHRLGFSATYQLRDGISEISMALLSGLLDNYTAPGYSNYLTLSETSTLRELREARRINSLYDLQV